MQLEMLVKPELGQQEQGTKTPSMCLAARFPPPDQADAALLAAMVPANAEDEAGKDVQAPASGAQRPF
jgi:hypothetical protein